MASPGRLRHRVTIQAASESQNSQGEAVATWADVATVWASVEPVRGDEIRAADRVAGRASVRVGLRYRSGLTVRHRFLFGGRVLEINEIADPGERHAELICLCTEAV